MWNPPRTCGPSSMNKKDQIQTYRKGLAKQGMHSYNWKNTWNSKQLSTNIKV
ncbi:unnamed protein product, partial [Schistosoma mattheei]